MGGSAHHGHDGQGHDDYGHDDYGENPADVVRDEAFWDEMYQSSSTLWSGHVNPQLVSEAADLSPGVALDVGCGEGADAIWLAEHGWRVTAVDLSTVALERGAAHALEVGTEVAQRITWRHADLADWVPVAASFDLVSAQFMHLPKGQRELFFTASDVATSFAPDQWVTLVDEARERTTLDPNGRTTTVHDAVLRA